MLAPCPNGCGQLHPTDTIVGQVPVQQANSVIGGTIADCETAVVVEPGAIARIRGLTSRDCTTGIELGNGGRLSLVTSGSGSGTPACGRCGSCCE